MRYGISLAHSPITERAELARAAESGGFSSIWTEDADALIALAVMAGTTEKAQLGSGIVRAPARAPLALATAVGNIQELSGGRMILGLGTGTKRQNLTQFGVEYDHPASRVKELIRFLRVVLDPGPNRSTTFQGRFITTQLTGGAAHRGQSPAPPMYLAAVNSGMLHVAGEVCDGLCGHPVYSVPFIHGPVLDDLGVGFARGGRRRADFDLAGWVITSIDSDRRQARRDAAYQIGFYLSTRSYARITDFHGWHAQKQAIEHAYFVQQDMEAVADAITDDMIDMFAVAGTPDDCRQQLRRYEGVLDTAVLYSHGSGPSRGRATDNLRRIIELFGS